jgi:hypothetical protein
MVNEKKAVKIQLRDGTVEEGQLEFSGGPPWRLLWSGATLSPQEFSGEDLFEALVALRLELEKIEALLLCAGARSDVFPSGMSRGMGGGRKAYITRIGAPALRTDLVDIFEYAKPEIVGTVAQQQAHHKKWAESLRL